MKKRQKKLQGFDIPILNSEYAVSVFIGSRDLVKKALVRHTKYAPRTIENDFRGRGITYNIFPDSNPVIGVDGDLKFNIAIATLAHEAIHAVNFISEYLGMKDTSGEFLAHGVGEIMRKVLEEINKSKT